MKTPELIVVGGPNGAGKTTFALEYVMTHNIPYYGADAIAAELTPDNPFSARIEASRVFLARIYDALDNKRSMVVYTSGELPRSVAIGTGNKTIVRSPELFAIFESFVETKNG